ncbi:hypothetical protein HMI55_006107 [Coelomomyces lativittatus]|nr:hypothetical protein HMI55_006107 [Coelomomyces lativittatus]
MKTSFLFGKWSLPPGEVFFNSALSLGIVNYKPVVPGHVLVLPRRVIGRFSELSSEEVSDLWLSAQSIGQVIQKVFNATSLTFAIQYNG